MGERWGCWGLQAVNKTVGQTVIQSTKFHINIVIIHPIQTNNTLQNKGRDRPNSLSPPLSLTLTLPRSPTPSLLFFQL